MTIQHLRSSTANKRPTPAAMSDGQLAVNTNTASPGLFFKDSAGALIKVGPVHVGTTAPNASPASGGETGNTVGEQWLDTTGGTYVFKTWDGSAWRSESGTFVDVNGDVMTGALGIIAGSAGSPGLYFSGDTNTGLYSPGADQVAISTGGAGRLFVDASGRVGVGTTPGRTLDVAGSIRSGGSTNPFIALNDNTTEAYFEISSSVTRISSGTSQPLAFRIGSSEAARFDSSGRLGVGISLPDNLLHVSGTSSTPATFERTGTTGTFVAFKDSTSLTFIGNTNGVFSIQTPGNSYSDKLVVTSAGNVGIGAPGPSSLLHLVSSGQPTITVADADGRSLQIKSPDSSANPGFVGTTTNHDLLIQAGTTAGGLNAMRFNTAGSERARIDSSGRLLVGASSDSGGALLQVNGDRVRIATAKTPASASDTGTTGEICWDANYIYVCTATNTWKRSAISTW
jgi:hypothetical protein